MRRNEGFGLVELMIAALATCLLLAGFLSAATLCQRWSSHFVLLLERDANLWLTPLLLGRWILPAGNNRWGQEWAGFSVDPDRLTIRSDIDGSGGFPDNELSSSFEELALRCSGTNLQIRSGDGSFQPFLKNVREFQPDPADAPLISIRLEAVADRKTPLLNHSLLDSVELRFALRNYRQNLFPENPQ